MLRRRDPERTRSALLDAAFQEIYAHGFKAASLDRIPKAAGVTKGALYHHFTNKQALGYAMVDERLTPRTLATWVKPLEQTDDPVGALQAIVASEEKEADDTIRALGCPVNNLAQEMSAEDEGFRRRIQALYDAWRTGIAAALVRGQAAGRVRADLSPDDTAAFVVAAWEGATGLGKSSRGRSLHQTLRRAFDSYLDSLRPPNS